MQYKIEMKTPSPGYLQTGGFRRVHSQCIA